MNHENNGKKFYLDKFVEATSEEHRHQRIIEYLQQKMLAIMKKDSNTALPTKQVFKELGFDSIMVTELVKSFYYDLNMKISLERIIRADNIKNLAVIIENNVILQDEMILKNKTPENLPKIKKKGQDDFHDASLQVPQIHAVVTEQQQRKLKIEDKWIYDFASCNYLGLDLRSEIMEVIPPALKKWGVHPSWTRAVASPEICEELENALADLLGVYSVLVFPAVTLLHAGILPILAGDDGVIFKDLVAHRSIYEACCLASSFGTTIIDFKHNDVADLEEKLAEYPLEQIKIIAIDGVYSMSGIFAPLPEYARLAKTYNAYVYMDDAHGLGIVGENPTSEMPYGFKGNGIVKHFGLDYEKDRMIYVAGLSKSYSSFGAFITCIDEEIKNKFRSASTFIFSGPSPVASLASAIAGIKLNMIEGNKWREQVYKLTYKLVNEAKAIGFEVVNDNYFPIVGVVVGNTKQVVAACNILWDYGILITPAIFPIVPFDRGLLRFSITAANTEEEIDRALESLKGVYKELNI